MTPEELLQRLEAYPRISLAEYPTPLIYLERLSRKIGHPVYLKRDDSIGPPPGGNKTRKLEYLLADAIAKKHSKVVTFGALQSNHARLTAAAARLLNLQAHLFYFGQKPSTFSGNLKLCREAGAHLHFFPGGNRKRTLESTIRIVKLLSWLRLDRNYFIPVGGHCWRGCLGYVRAAAELETQIKEQELTNPQIIMAAGTGGTLAGMLAGFILMNSKSKTLGIDVGKLWSSFRSSIADLAGKLCRRLGENRKFEPAAVPLIEEKYVGEAYGIPTEMGASAMREIFETEGIALDPVYTGKAFAGALDLIRSGQIPPGDPLIFLHTGGVID